MSTTNKRVSRANKQEQEEQASSDLKAKKRDAKTSKQQQFKNNKLAKQAESTKSDTTASTSPKTRSASKEKRVVTHPKALAKLAAQEAERQAKKERKEMITEKYDTNQQGDSDDSSDEEVLLRTGDVPRQWYELYDHQGYSVKGQTVEKMVQQDELEKFIERQNDKNWWMKITDELNNKQVRLSKADLELLQRIKSGKFAEKEVDPYSGFDLDFGNEKFKHPFNSDEPKRRFVMSKWERLKINKFIQSMKKGWMKTIAQQKEEEERQREQEEKVWDIWEDDSIVTWKPRRMPKPITAPKRDLPIHSESYNPPEEYLLDEKEQEEWKEQEPEDRRLNFLPQKIESLRKVPLYQQLIQEHFERCLDLYLCPRLMKKKVNVQDLSQLMPELPSPNDLKPFPTQVSIDFDFHTTCVRSLAVSPCGKYLASGDESSNLVIWNTTTSKIVRKYQLANKVVDNLAWNPKTTSCMLAACNENIVYILQPQVYGIKEETISLFNMIHKDYDLDKAASSKKEVLSSWSFEEDYKNQKQILIKHNNITSRLVWHPKGDYLATMAHNLQSSSQVLIHSLQKATTMKPFGQAKGIIQAIAFHPLKPHFFAASHQTVFQYNLQKQSTVSKYNSGAKWISSIDIHPKGDNFILGTYDKNVIWFDMDMGSAPYKKMKYHEKAIRSVKYHQKYPLFASCSDDGSVNVFYGLVYNDLLQNALVVPLKILKAHTADKNTGLGAMNCEFHPTQPWLFTSGADGNIKLWV